MSELRQVRRAPEINPPLTPVHGTPIDHPSAWTVADFKTPADYTIELDAAHLRDIEHAIRQIKTAGLGLDDLRREHFEPPSLRPVIDEIRRQIADGRGFVVLRRLPVEDYSKDEIGMIFWGIGTAECEEVASLVTYLASDLAHFVNGTMIEIDGGQHDLADRLSPDRLHLVLDR
ncbi:MAG TPA: hypothetical protein VJX94_27160 [Stellaceae bacterium]|nr:hypothetical protein [Stellaceae bacterium]